MGLGDSGALCYLACVGESWSDLGDCEGADWECRW